MRIIYLVCAVEDRVLSKSLSRSLLPPRDVEAVCTLLINKRGGNSEGEKGREAERRKRFYGTLRIHKESQLREDNIDDNEGVKMSKAGIAN